VNEKRSGVIDRNDVSIYFFIFNYSEK